jgi:predicted amidohydrolase YtcJ
MTHADVVITGTVLAFDHARPTAEALAVADGRIVTLGDGCEIPGFVEAPGYPLMEPVALSDRIVDKRPVTVRHADDVVAAVGREVKTRGAAGACLNGWVPLLQPGLAEPTPAWLDELTPDRPLVIVHNSGHKAYFNSHSARCARLTRRQVYGQ